MTISETLKERAQSRKFIFAAILFVVSTTLLIFSFAQFQEWADFMQWIFGIYAAGNGVEHAATIVGNRQQSPPGPGDDSMLTEI